MTIINEKLDPNNTGLVAGTLDVSACSTSKISHYKPAATQPTAATQATTQATTQAADSSADTGDGYTDNFQSEIIILHSTQLYYLILSYFFQNSNAFQPFFCKFIRKILLKNYSPV